jgi:antitoxin MazE
MATQLARWGNSLAIRIPKTVLRQAGLREGEAIDVSLWENGAVVLRRATATGGLEDLVARITPANRHVEMNDECPETDRS